MTAAVLGMLLGICIQQCRDDGMDGGKVLDDHKTCRCFLDHKLKRQSDLKLHLYINEKKEPEKSKSFLDY